MLKELKKRWEVRLHQVLTEDEISRIMLANEEARLESLKTGHRATMIEWMIFNTSFWGLRISESAFLECGQIYLDGDISCLDLRETKFSKPRDVYIGPIFSQYLREYLAWKKLQGDPIDRHAPFFYSRPSKTFMTAEGLRKAFKRAIARGNISKHPTPHSGRHSLASHMAGQFLRLVQKELGHSSLATTEIYIHVLDPKIKDFVDEYERIIYSGLEKKKIKGDKV